jgi:hypothetical protein
LVPDVFLPCVAHQLRVSSRGFGVVHVDYVAHAACLLVHFLDSTAFHWQIVFTQVAGLLLLDYVIHQGWFNFGGCEAESAACVARGHDSVIVELDFVNAVVFIASVGLPENFFSKVGEGGHISRFRIPDEGVDALCHGHLILVKRVDERIFVKLSCHVVLDRSSDLILSRVRGRVTHSSTVLFRSPMEVNIKGLNRSLRLHFLLIPNPRVLQNL